MPDSAAVALLRRVVEADVQDAKMGHPNPGDSCIAICIALEVLPFLDGIGATVDDERVFEYGPDDGWYDKAAGGTDV